MSVNTSVIIPARRERFLDQTIKSIFDNFKGDFEVIVTLDGKEMSPLPKGVTYLRNKTAIGMRTSINQAVAVAKGKYLMKIDAHCMVDEGIDQKLIAEHKDNWVQIPQRRRLDARNWKVIIDERPFIDYMYIGKGYMGGVNNQKNRREDLRKDLIVNAPTFQGSCYFINRDFFNKIGLLDDVNFAQSGHEAQEICFKARRAGGEVKRNKKTWYAHARLNRFYATDRVKSRSYIIELAKQCRKNGNK